jgi:hypothetical protein
VLLVLCGGAVQHIGWWSLYGDLGLWCGAIGGIMLVVGGYGFDDIGKCGLLIYTALGLLATWSSWANCPPSHGKYVGTLWGERYDTECSGTVLIAAFLLVPLCSFIVCAVRQYLSEPQLDNAAVDVETAGLGVRGGSTMAELARLHPSGAPPPAVAVAAVASTPSARDVAVPAEIDGDVLPEGNPPTPDPHMDEGRQLSEYIAELAQKQEALREQQAELSRRQDDLQQELEEARRRQRDADADTETETETETELEAESPSKEFKVEARAVLYL